MSMTTIIATTGFPTAMVIPMSTFIPIPTSMSTAIATAREVQPMTTPMKSPITVPTSIHIPAMRKNRTTTGIDSNCNYPLKITG
jgi:hypothetical protein